MKLDASDLVGVLLVVASSGHPHRGDAASYQATIHTAYTQTYIYIYKRRKKKDSPSAQATG